MADLITNLQSIYNTKLQIKDAIGTDSDIFADYPSYINSLKPTGYAYITTNGDHNVNAYSYVNVNVPTGGGAAVLGNLSVTENGQYSASAYSYDGFDTVDVNVPQPTLGSANITANGNYNASDLGFDGLNSVIVNVPTSGGGSSHTGSSVYDAMTIKEALDWVYANLKVGDSSSDWFYVKGIIAEASSPITAQYGNFNAWLTDDGQMHYQTEDPTLSDLTKCLYVFRGMFYGHSTEHATWDPNTDMQIHVGDQVIMYCQLRWHTSNVPRIINGSLIKQGVTAQNQLTISQSGTYDVQNYVSAYVNVSGGGSSTTTLSVSGEYGIYNGKYYIYDTNLTTYLTLLGPIEIAGLGDTVSGTVEYSDIDGSGMPYKYICKNFNGISTQDSDRVYTSLNVNYYGGTSSSMLLSTVGGGISSNYYPLETENGVTYYLPSNYSGSTFENGSTVYCYVSECYPMMEQKYMINEVVNVVNPNLTGVSYSTDSGANWNSMVSDTMINGYSVDNLEISIDPMNSHSFNIRYEYDNGSYKYVTNYVSITSEMKPYSSMIQKDSMMTSMTVQNDSGSNIKISKIGVNNDTIYVYWEQGITYNYRIVATDSNGTPTGNKYAMNNDPSMGWRYDNWYDQNIEYFYIEKFIVGEDTGIENYKSSEPINMENSSRYSVSTAGTALFHLTDDTKNRIYFNAMNMQVWYERMNYISLRDSNNTELCKVYTMDVGTTFNNTNSVSGCYFTDAGGAINYKTGENISISSTYDGTITVNHINTGTITIDAGNYNLYYEDAAAETNAKNVFIHGIMPHA